MTRLTSTQISTIISEFGKNSVTEWFTKHDTDLLNIVTLVMIVVEQASSKHSLNASEKLDIAKQMIPILIDELIRFGIITQVMCDDIKKEINSNSKLIDNFINIAAYLTNHPDLINPGKWGQIIKESKWCGCFSSK